MAMIRGVLDIDYAEGRRPVLTLAWYSSSLAQAPYSEILSLGFISKPILSFEKREYISGNSKDNFERT